LKKILAAGSFDDLRAGHYRFFEEASKLGKVNAVLFSDAIIRSLTGNPPKFPLVERLYLLESIKYVQNVYALNDEKITAGMRELIQEIEPEIYVTEEKDKITAQEYLPDNKQIELRVIPDERLEVSDEFIEADVSGNSGVKKVVVTGCYDWFHSGHVAFFRRSLAIRRFICNPGKR